MTDFVQLPDDKPAVVRSLRAKPESADTRIAEQFLKLLLATFGDRTTAIFSAIFMCGELAAAFWLWYGILAQPDVPKLTGGAIFCAFVLSFEWVRRRKGSAKE